MPRRWCCHGASPDRPLSDERRNCPQRAHAAYRHRSPGNAEICGNGCGHRPSRGSLRTPRAGPAPGSGPAGGAVSRISPPTRRSAPARPPLLAPPQRSCTGPTPAAARPGYIPGQIPPPLCAPPKNTDRFGLGLPAPPRFTGKPHRRAQTPPARNAHRPGLKTKGAERRRHRQRSAPLGARPRPAIPPPPRPRTAAGCPAEFPPGRSPAHWAESASPAGPSAAG